MSTPGIDKAAATYLAANPLLGDPGEPSAVFAHALVDAYGNISLDAEALRKGDVAAQASFRKKLGFMIALNVQNGNADSVIINGIPCPAGFTTSVGVVDPFSIPATNPAFRLEQVGYGNSNSSAITLTVTDSPFALPIMVPPNAAVSIVVNQSV